MPGIDQTLGGKIFSLGALADQLRVDMEFAVKNKDMRKALELNDRINEIDNKRVQMMAQMGDKEMMKDMRPGFALGGGAAIASAARNIPGRVKDLANTVMGRKIPGRMTDKGNLTSAASFGAVPMPRIPGSGMVGPLSGAIVGAGGMYAAKYPEEFGAAVARGQLTFEQAVEAATQKLGELGQIAGETLGQTIGNIGEAGQASGEAIAIIKEQIRRGYQQEIERQKQKEIEQIAAEDKPIVPVFAEGGEAEMEMEPEGDDIQESLMAIESVSQEAAPLDQVVQQVVQMIQQGATEEQVIGMLKQMGLDDEDIAAVFQAVIEMLQGPSIDSELAALG